MTEPRILRTRVYEVALPLREPFVISGGSLTVRRSLIVELKDAHGKVGLGESAPFEKPFYSSETVASARACLRDILLVRVLDQPVTVPSRCAELLSAGVQGNRMARAGVETAWWDLIAARRGVTLATLVSERLAELGVPAEWRATRSHIDCGVALGIPPEMNVSVLRTWVAQALGRGYKRIKLKVRPGWDVEPIRIAREEMQRARREVPMWVDANGSYDATRDQDALRKLDSMQLLFLEQPLPADGLWDSRELGRELKTPICLDESLVSDSVARQVIAMEGPRVWNLKIQRVGGLEEACRIYARAVQAGIALWAGTMPETGLGAQAMLALAGHAGFVYPSDIEPSERWYVPGVDLVELTMDAQGRMPVPDARLDPRMPLDAELVAALPHVRESISSFPAVT
ncbi:MAG: o-succinylbenzoate synthase [Gemmatimonadetes bacterium]|nr:o-succinylbenzoate synthase [Gemmatimonadota bacterium]